MEGAYNSEMYKGKCKPKEHQEDYCKAVRDEWCNGILDTDQHQKAAPASVMGASGPAQSSSKPSQF